MFLPSQNATYTACPSVVGVDDAKELSARIVAGSPGMLFCQRTLPSAVSRHRRLRDLPSLLDAWRNRFLPQTMGLALPTPGSATFQRTLASGPNVSGTFLSSVVAVPLGPRKRSQWSAWARPARTAITTSACVNRAIWNSGGWVGGLSQW